ncbi:MAG TPA: ABC transporter permease [Longimicrobiales bacterium]|nr:ABC transporter permease [Longimicrobiales bacterium]
MSRSRSATAAFWLVIAFLWAPVAVLVAYSFNDSRFSAQWTGFTLDWYHRVFSSAETAAALRNTLIISTISTVVSTVLGTMLAIGLHMQARGRGAVELLLYMPIIVPDIIMGVATLALYVATGMPLGHASVVLAHVAFQISFVALIVRARLHDFPVAVLEAARDLGASRTQTLRHVVLPLLRPGIAAAALIAFALSVDDFVITYFTAGAGASTLPVRIYSMVKRGVTPDINALSTLLLLVTITVLAVGTRLNRTGESHS